MKNKKKQEWFCEGAVPGRRFGKIQHCFLIDKTVFKGKTSYQDILIFDNSIYGRVLVLDGIVQLSKRDEYIYHEMITHPIFLSHPKPEKVLIVGGGDGGTLRETLKHPVKEVCLVDIDKDVIEISKKYLPFVSKKAFQDNRVNVFIENGIKFVKRYDDYFDATIIDCNDPMGPSIPLYSVKFYRDVFKAMKENAVLMVQVGSFLDFNGLIKKIFLRLKKVFPYVKMFRLTIPSYHCGEYCFIGASKGIDFDKVDFKDIEKRFNRLAEQGATFRYYSPEVHRASMILPKDFNIQSDEK